MAEVRGKNVVITGASRGIGVYIARAFAERGANLALVARDASALEQLARELGERVRAVSVPADLARTDDYGALVERIERELGPIDVLVNNAAIEANSPYAEYSPETIAELLHVDLTAPMLLTRAVLPGLLARGSGHVVNVASLAGKTPTAYNVTYGAAKAGLIMFSRGLRAELHGSGVGISVVCPGFVVEAGMFATKMEVAKLEAPKAVGTTTPAAVAAAVVKAVERNRAELNVAPGPMRLLHAVDQIFPEAGSSLSRKLGVPELFRRAGIAEREAAQAASEREAAQAAPERGPQQHA